ncbi:hypothetical protein [Streptomyces sp. BV129]|uniref:hypothetical protein n=1 Tax=Streptomyces sp. BV129 TaxID=2849671 RepID=UPI001C2E9141|nr:hypothetical protein [Streptomyces sp. BV129]MBV1946011.1 hypothetical protein [Streptomyces sp. BV129]
MPVPAHTRPHPAPVATRLPWWALALPTLAFVALLMLIMNPSDAHAASGDPALAQVVERARQLVAH